MIKIDLHLHTVPSLNKNENFIFSVTDLERYINEKSINAIAITNHNIFDKNNYYLIKNHLSISVFPGIEIDLESGHILVISDFADVDEFDKKCLSVKEIVESHGKLTINDFLSIFSEKYKYLFIPHYKKKPAIQKETIEAIGSDVFCGEVDNQNKFIRLYKEKKDLVPVLFSDSRPTKNFVLPMRFTYLDINSSDFKSIKEALKDREKVFLTNKKAHSTFQILKDGTEASTGLNIILGKRSSGKTHTIDSIYNNFSNNQKIKYIRQFELIEKKDNEKEEQEFNEKLGEKSSLFAAEYLDEFKRIVDVVQMINRDNLITSAEDYISRLLEFAADSDKHDSFAKVPLFSEQKYSSLNANGIERIIDAVIALLESNNYKSIIEKYISFSDLVSLLKESIEIYKKEELHFKAIEYTNVIMDIIKKDLTIESNQESIPTFDIITYAKNIREIQYFEKLVYLINTDKIIKTKPYGRFTLSARRTAIATASELQRVFKNKAAYSQIIVNREKPYQYLMLLKESKLIETNDLYKAFVKIEFSVLNSDGLKVSGGERAEFNLEEKLQDASNYEMLLLDEPESSFDNLFLKDHIFKKIKALSTKMPVFVSTHNNVVGASFQPNFILFTEKTIENNSPVFRIYCGEPTEKELVTFDGKKTLNKIVQLNCLEGGEDSCNERKDTYGNIKN